eukprot:1270688-Rhodomonas_salina.1
MVLRNLQKLHSRLHTPGCTCAKAAHFMLHARDLDLHAPLSSTAISEAVSAVSRWPSAARSRLIFGIS